MDVVDHGSQVVAPDEAAARAGGLVLDGNGLVASSEEMTPEVTPRVEPTGVGVLEPLHHRDEVGIGSEKDGVVEVVHQHTSEEAPVRQATDRMRTRLNF